MLSSSRIHYTFMNEENTTQTQDPTEENGETEANVEEEAGGEQNLLPTPPELPTELPPVPSVRPTKGNRYTPRRGPR